MNDESGLSADDLVEILTPVGVVMIGIGIVTIVAVVRSDTADARWTAIGAVATAIEALAVVGALFYAKGQLSQAKSSDTLARRVALIDRISSSASNDFAPALTTYRTTTAELAGSGVTLTQLDPNPHDFIVNEQLAQQVAAARAVFAAQKERVRVAYAEAHAAIRQLDRLVRTAGQPGLLDEVDQTIEIAYGMIPVGGSGWSLEATTQLAAAESRLNDAVDKVLDRVNQVATHYAPTIDWPDATN